MLTFSIIRKSQLEGAHRLDAEFYQPEYLKVSETLQSLNAETKLLGDIITRPVATGSTPKKRGCKGDGTDIKFIKTDTLRNGEILFEHADCLPESSSRKHSEPKDGDVLVTIIGATHDIVGRSALVFAGDPRMNINQNIALIRVDPGAVLPSLLETFLRSKFGRDQLWQLSRQTEQVNLNCREVELVKIPLFALGVQREIDDLIKLSRKQRSDSLALYGEAENLLLEELGLKDFEVEDDLSYIVNLSEIKSAHRVDAEYFQPKYEKLIKHIKEGVEMQQLKTIATTKRGSLIDPRFYDETEGTPYIRGKDFSSGRLGKSGLVYIGRDFRPKNETRVDNGDLAFALIGSVGTSALVNEEFHNSFISNNTGKVSIKNKKEVLPEYLAAVLNSIVGKLQFEKEASQTAQPKISDPQVRNFYIPILPQSTQQKIADLVRQSHESRKKAKELLEEAKRKVEEMIEKGGEG